MLDRQKTNVWSLDDAKAVAAWAANLLPRLQERENGGVARGASERYAENGIKAT